MATLREKDLPRGMDFLRLMRALEQLSAEDTWKALPTLGKKLPAAVEAMGTVLSYLDRIASCFYGCSHDDHRLQYLVGRVTTLAHSALLLTAAGHYDEALALIRVLGEVTNLLSLFDSDKAELEKWKTLRGNQHWNYFRPYKVRGRLDNLKKAPSAVDSERYSMLSSVSVHIGPDSMPNAQNDEGRARLAPRFEEAGLMVCINELARCIAIISVTATSLIDTPTAVKRRTRMAGHKLAINVGGVDVMMQGRPWLKLH
jgi:hypothetical protein